MKTRTLLLLAVVCAFVILIAGSIKIFLIADESPAQHLGMGQTGVAGDMRVTLVSAEPIDGQLLVTVRIGGVADDDGAVAFKFGNGGDDLLRPTPANSDVSQPCAATTVAEAQCVVAFDTTDVRGVLLYERTSQDILRWDVDAG